MLSIALLILAAVLAGALSGAFTVRWFLRRTQRSQSAVTAPTDEWTAAEIDRAAAVWAMANGRSPQAAGVMADKLHLLHHLGQRRGWRSS